MSSFQLKLVDAVRIAFHFLVITAFSMLLVGRVLACEPTLTLNCPGEYDSQSYIDGLSVQINGYVDAPPPCTPLHRLSWDWGDSNIHDAWFPAAHDYANAGTYTITVEALDTGDGVLATDSCEVTVPPPIDVIFSDGMECGEIAGNCRPTFDGLTLLTTTDEDEVTLAWFTAHDDDTAPENIQYDVYLSLDENFQPTPATLKASLVGEISTVVDGLIPDSRYYALIVARDQSGQGSVERDYLSVTTPGFPNVPSTTHMHMAADLNLDIPISSDELALIFTNGPGVTAPTVGTVLIGPLPDGRGYMRMVESVSESPAEIVVTTRMASLDEVMDQMHLSTIGVLGQPEAPAAASAATADMSAGSNTHVFAKADGSRVTRTVWPNRLLVMERTDYVGATGPLVFGPGEAQDTFRIQGGDSYDWGEVILDLDLNFKPELVTDANWTILGGFKEATVLARGTMSLTAKAGYEFSAAGGVHPDPFKLFKVTWTAFYFVGTVPVYQQIELEVEVQVGIDAQAEVNATTTAKAGVMAEVGATYSEPGGWQAVSNLETSKSFEVDLGVSGSVNASISLVPSLKVEFYEVVAARLSVEPSLNGAIEAEGTTNPLCFPIQLTALSADLGVECKVALELFHYAVWGDTICQLGPYELYSLPTLSFAASGYGPIDLTATAEDGINNSFNPASILWDASGGTGILSPTSGSPSTTLTCPDGGNHTVTLSGHGELGPLARQCMERNLPCLMACDSDGDCPPEQVCHNGACRTLCPATPCPEGQLCDAGGICRHRCNTTEDCSNGELCTYRGSPGTTFICVDANDQPCAKIADCPGEYPSQTCMSDTLTCQYRGDNRSCYGCWYGVAEYNNWHEYAFFVFPSHSACVAYEPDVSKCPPYPCERDVKITGCSLDRYSNCTGLDALDPQWQDADRFCPSGAPDGDSTE